MVLRKGDRAAKFIKIPYIMNNVGIKLNIPKYF